MLRKPGENGFFWSRYSGLQTEWKAEVYSETCQTSKMELFVKIVNGYLQNAPS